jgi:hypothetical protein
MHEVGSQGRSELRASWTKEIPGLQGHVAHFWSRCGAQRRSLPSPLRRTPGRPKGGALTSSRAVHARGEASHTPRAPRHA